MLTEDQFVSPEAYALYKREVDTFQQTIDDLTARLNPCLKALNDGIEYDDDCNPINA